MITVSSISEDYDPPVEYCITRNVKIFWLLKYSRDSTNDISVKIEQFFFH